MSSPKITFPTKDGAKVNATDATRPAIDSVNATEPVHPTTPHHDAASQKPTQPPDDKSRKVWVAVRIHAPDVLSSLRYRRRVGWDGNPPEDVGGVFTSILTNDVLGTEVPVEHTGPQPWWAPKTQITARFHLEHTNELTMATAGVSMSSGPFNREIQAAIRDGGTWLGAAYPKKNPREVSDTQLCVSGSPYVGERVEAAALREVREELGIAVELTRLEPHRTNRKGVKHYLVWAVAR